MPQSRRHRYLTVCFALFSLLFGQLAMASYVCPSAGAVATRIAQHATMAEAGMPCAESMAIAADSDVPSLCQAHCKAEQRALDHVQLPVLAALPDLRHGLTLERAHPKLMGGSLQATLLQRNTTPPLAVRNCCFRL